MSVKEQNRLWQLVASNPKPSFQAQCHLVNNIEIVGWK